MKKRAVISVILTILLMVLTNQFWLKFVPMPVSMDIKGTDNVKITVQLNKKNNDEFKKIKFQEKKVNFNKTKKVSFNVDRARNPKRVQFIISDLENKNNITIKNINLRNGKLKLDNNKFDVKGAKHTVSKDVLVLQPEDNKIVITYKEPIKIRSSIKFEFEIFVSLLVLGFLLIYKLTDYLADFKTIRNQSRIDIIFLLIFFVILFIPMSKINQAKISKQENRTLTKWQSLITENSEINFNFGKNFDNWFNDRFNGRELFISFNNDIQKKVSMYFYTKGTYIWNKTNNWLGSSSATNRNNSLSNEKNKLKMVQNIRRIKKLCDENNIKLYILISPVKEEIYYTEIFNKKLKRNIHDLAIETIKFIKNETGVDIIYVYDELLELSKDELVFFKTDHHWTDAGAYIGYLALMNEIKKDFPNIYINKTDDFNYTTSNMVRVTPDYFYEGRTYNSLNLKDKKILDTKYKYFEHKNYKDVRITTTKHEKLKWVREYFYDDKYYDVYFYGDSFTLNLLQMLPFSFKYTKNIYIPTQSEKSDLALHEEDILENKANILILCFEGINKLTNIYKDVE